ncbi:Asp-tRNA(Asn)/Glu-tRNA(Gln) amidotransferase GatCAB subunit C [Candidatus Shapirobacteria bacterium CG10_big_fil_rev_8_21_14_0_10_40_9]|uniref:Aspartyl/glutamyl-tRNA(Asn/Gln) amidotransferase subunit C n=1 Tax=Candidatus Shapirobacteria bacterium CG10_big_fil_rev_8_21_14_0_10_40_9 TaxID=1974888 RepID=A0A2M8L4C6_9BACT|nr:MAG: Asp-tRNA(Asn)/Glu-tRNA(Gln) amidotransferase GatCAB subunit C [Candidatus Shapirobacteria bacterium CG10_big_fil_rev_8_21_14_0_10_40_9]
MKKNAKRKTQNAKLSEREVIHVAKLAGLVLNPQEVKKFQKQLSEVLKYIEILNEIETKGVEPTSQVTGLENVFREDKVGPSLSQKEVLSGVKNKKDNMFKTKAVLE